MSIKIYTVSEISGLIKDILESNFYGIWVEGEVSSLRYSSTGHLYFSLIDEDASLGVIIYRNRLKNIRFNMKNGLRVTVFGSLSLYLKGGGYRLTAEHIRVSGSGKKFFDLEKIKKEFKAKGYFDRKRAMPAYPSNVVVVTSPTGAAVQDIINIVQRRGFGINVYIYPVSVQGDEAKQSILKALNDINGLNDVDLVILARGGGSNEDLWIFNDPDIAKALFDIKFPTISAIGHEIDFTLCDFVADLRAETPSAAAEIITKSRLEIKENIGKLKHLLNASIQNIININRKRIMPFTGTRYYSRINGLLGNKILYLDNLEHMLRSILSNIIRNNASIIQRFAGTLERNSPQNRLKAIEHEVEFFNYRTNRALRLKLENSKKNLDMYLYKLNSTNPENILKRGYTITTNLKGIPIKSVYTAKKEGVLITRFSDGKVKSTVEK